MVDILDNNINKGQDQEVEFVEDFHQIFKALQRSGIGQSFIICPTMFIITFCVHIMYTSEILLKVICGLQPMRLLCPWVLQTRILEWVAIPFSRGSSYNEPKSPALQVGSSYSESPGKPITYTQPCSTVVRKPFVLWLRREKTLQNT